MKRRAGREPDTVAALDGAEHLWLPSGRQERTGEPSRGIEIARSGTPMSIARLRDDLARSYPAGVVRIDPTRVTAGQPAEPYEVLPHTAGLVQLLEQGKLEPGRGWELIVRTKIRYPAGLAGGRAVRFRVPAGVPRPDGDPGHSCVVFDDSDGPTGTATCK